MKVLWLAPIPYIDDNTSHPAPWVITLAKALVKNGVDLTILNYNSEIEEEIIIKDFNSIKLVYIKTPKLKLDVLTLYQLRIKKMSNYLTSIIYDYALLHIHGTEHQYEAMALKLDIPKVISIQGIMTEYIKILPKFGNYKTFIQWALSTRYEKNYLPYYNYFSCRTHWDTNFVKKINPKAKIFTIWEMIRAEFFEDHFDINSKKILFMGGKNPIKGLKELLRAFDCSLQEKGLKLIILGNCQRKDIENMITKYKFLHIDLDNVECRGMQDTQGMIEAYDESFCLVHPTYIDNSPNSVCEAQLAGLPVIATNVGGVSSLVKDRETGLLIGRVSHEIEYAVNLLLNNNKLREYISQKSREVARRRHNPNLILQQTLNMYSDMLSDKR